MFAKSGDFEDAYFTNAIIHVNGILKEDGKPINSESA
jgi:hypothetical protein